MSRKLQHEGKFSTSAHLSPQKGLTAFPDELPYRSATSKRASSSAADTSHSGTPRQGSSSVAGAMDHRVSDSVREGQLSKSLNFGALDKAFNPGGVFGELLRRESQAEAAERLQVTLACR